MIDQNLIKEAFKEGADIYGIDKMKIAECLIRNETAHFTSGNYLVTLSPGWQATTESLPYGWTSLAQFWNENPDLAPTGIHLQVENNSDIGKSQGVQKFMIFPSVRAGVLSLCKLLDIRSWNAGTWCSTNKGLQDKYNEDLTHIIPRFVNALTQTT